ncbi:MAG: DNA polymerase III subunit delta' [Rhizobiaceae bacterium]|nr:MAG: DNA polymerase III subunit delta' [Rhizobiaceae bacterium]CAG1007399.1 DNA polymerase III subunit delta' [Rhizobiaceae bacterium]
MFERIAPEQHDTLDRIPEPSANPFLAGHGQAAAALAAAYRAGKLPHALLFTGPRGIGKATLAFHFVYHVLTNPDHTSAPGKILPPDPKSTYFRQVAAGSHPSVLHLTRPANDRSAAGFKSAITVDEVRRVSRFTSHTAHDGGYRFVVVDPADDMNVSAANALLKSLEEPPARTVFILIAHSAGRLLPTIRSRCQAVRFSPLVQDDLYAVLERLEIDLPADAEGRAALAAAAAGSPRTAVLMTEYGGLEVSAALDKLLGAPHPPGVDAHRLADAVAAKDRAIQFMMFNDRLLDVLAEAAGDAARTGDIERAVRLSGAWQEMRVAIGEADTYNLDRKQHALTMILRLHDTLRM